MVLLLRQRLDERVKASRAARTGTVHQERRKGTLVEELQALTAVEGLSDRQLKRALIQNILAEQFGPEALNDANFQQVVERVTETIEADGGGSQLLDRVVRELRAAAA
ncbi:MAG TPA: hypothetical protein VF559_04620 [Caulobacteraceae bacterium]